MATLTVTYPWSSTFNGTIAGVVFTNSSGTLDDATQAGGSAKAFFLRQGWAVTGTAAAPPTVAQGKPVQTWTSAELKAYLDANRVSYPSAASQTELLNAVLDAYETRAQGGSAALPAAGHLMGTFPVEGAPIVPGDDADVASTWHTPLSANSATDVAPTISVQPTGSAKVAPATATYSVTATGTPSPSYQWQRQVRGGGAYIDISGATSASYTTPALSVAENNGDRYRVKVSNSDGVLLSTAYQQVVS